MRYLLVDACVISAGEIDSPPQTKELQKAYIPVYGDIGIIVRPLSIGLCYSDVKIFESGFRNPRVERAMRERGWIILGHEVLYEVIEIIGATNFGVGDIVHIQPSAIFHGKKYYLGFTEPGALSTENFIGDRFLNSDVGGNVLKLSDIPINYSLALIEPWSCVEADLALNIKFKNRRLMPTYFLDKNSVIEEYRNIINDQPENNRPIDVLLKLDSKTTLIRMPFTDKLPKGSSLIVDTHFANSSIVVDLHDVHYRQLVMSSLHNYYLWQVSGEWRLANHYHGHVILFGGAGPMGQMYLRRIVMEDKVPEQITVVDRSEARLVHLSNILEHWPCPKSVLFRTICVPPEIDNGAEVSYISEKLFMPPDAIIVFCTDPKVVEMCIRIVKDGGVVNSFAGVPPGSQITISTKDIGRNIVLTGRSGSSINYSKLTTERIKKGELSLQDFVAKTIVLDDVWSSLMDVKHRRLNGKILVLPSKSSNLVVNNGV